MAERHEDTCRKDFTPEEAVRVGKTIEALLLPPAEAAKKSGKSADGKAGGRGRSKPVDDSSTGFNNREPNRRANNAAKTVGRSRSPYERDKAVVQAADEDKPWVGDE